MPNRAAAAGEGPAYCMNQQAFLAIASRLQLRTVARPAVAALTMTRLKESLQPDCTTPVFAATG
jgi:hypothetical protein